MKRYINILVSACLAFSTFSCSEDIMNDINKNINDPIDVGSKLIITDAMTSTAFSVIGSDLAFYASVYVEHNVGVFNQFYNAEIRSGEPINGSTYNNSWSSVYQNLLNLKTVIGKCDIGGSEEGNYHTLGIAQTLSALNLATLTDVMGDTPWTEALQPGVIFTPALDKQEDIYVAVNKFLDDAILNLQKESTFPNLGTQDFIYGGDVDNWLKFAYGLKARYAMRLSLRNPDYAAVIANADKSFTSADEEAKFVYNGATTTSPFYAIFTDRDYYGASTSLNKKLTDRKDPRADVFFKAYSEGGDIIFAPNGTPVQEQQKYAISAISTKTAPTFLLSYHELEFLKAEAYARQNNIADAKVALKLAIDAAFTKVNVGLTSEDAADYYTESVESRVDANAIEEIMNQKYLAFFEEEALEAYHDIRRLKAMGDDVIELDNPANSSKFPVRFTYGSDDITTNVNIREAYGDGTYVYTENVWWAGGSR